MVSLEQALAELERPTAHLPRLVGQTLATRLYGSQRLHRAVPTPLALRLAALRGRLEWHLVPRRRAHALRLTEMIRGLSPDTPEAAVFARRRLVEDAVSAELQWRPWLVKRMPIEGLDRFLEARAEGRGVIVATAHIGPFLGLVRGLAARGLKIYISGGEWGGPDAHVGRRGQWTAMQNRSLEEAGCRWVRRGGSYPILRALLERGEVCFIAVDAPGSLEVELAGHPARVRAGLASLALETGAAVVPGRTLRRGWGQVGILRDPVDTSQFDDPLDLTRHLLDLFGRTLLEYPEQVHENVFEVWAAAAR